MNITFSELSYKYVLENFMKMLLPRCETSCSSLPRFFGSWTRVCVGFSSNHLKQVSIPPELLITAFELASVIYFSYIHCFERNIDMTAPLLLLKLDSALSCSCSLFLHAKLLGKVCIKCLPTQFC